jgi:hypothetical protein
MSQEQRSAAFLFTPAVFFLLVGVLTVLAPGLILALVASVFLFLGIILATLAWKFMRFKKHVEKVAKDFQGKVHIQGLSVEDAEFTESFTESELTDAELVDADFEENEEGRVRKIILH